MTRHLLLLRHAEAGPYAQTEAGDRARALTAHGIQQAEQTGHALTRLTAQHQWHQSPNSALTLCSPAIRTRQTAEIALKNSPFPQQNINHPDALYSATAQNLLDIITNVDEHITTLLLVGHNPAISHVVHELCGPHLPDQARDALMQGYPPSTLTLFSIAENWYDMRSSTARFVSAHTT